MDGGAGDDVVTEGPRDDAPRPPRARSGERGAWLYELLRIVARPILRGLYRVRAEGVEKIPADGPVIIAANHASLSDSVFLPFCVPRRMVFLALADLFHRPVTGWILRALGMIPVGTSGSRRTSAIEAGLAALREGRVLGVYPEGTRSPDGRLYRGHTGVARLALESGAPVVPAGLFGSREVMPKGARLPRPWGRVIVRFGDPLTFDRHRTLPPSRFTLRAVTDEIMFEVAELTGQAYVDEYATGRRPASGNRSDAPA